MKQQEQQPWTLSLRARAKNLDLKLKLSRIFFPLPKPTQFSIQFKLLSYALEIRSKPKSTFPLKPKLLKRKFLQIFKIFHRERSRNNGIVRSWCAPKNNFNGRRKVCIWLWLLLFAVGWFTIMQLRYFLDGGRLIWKCLWMAWNYAASSGFLYQFFKVCLRRRRYTFLSRIPILSLMNDDD
ncbi:hypothetical protein ACS0TY_015606 [Phlomoides rotata]